MVILKRLRETQAQTSGIIKVFYYHPTHKRTVFKGALKFRLKFNQMSDTVTSASSHSTLPDDGDHTETCWSCCNFNVNFNTHLRTILLRISW